MTGQAALDGSPGHGLWKSVLDPDGGIDHAKWMRAYAESGFVGNCRLCGDYLVPRRPEEIVGRTDYSAYCRRGDSCRYELAAPNGRVMRHSTRQSDQPKPSKEKKA